LDAIVGGLFCAPSAIRAIARTQNTAVKKIKASAETDRFVRSLGMADLNQCDLLGRFSHKAAKDFTPRFQRC
jgi:hypothetical protein